MADPFFARLAACGWRVPAKQRIAYLTLGEDAVPDEGAVRIKIRGHPWGPHAAEWQLRVHPAALGRRGQVHIDQPYVLALTLDDALVAATAEAQRSVEQFRGAHVQRPPVAPRPVAAPAAHVPPLPRPGRVRNGYRVGKRTATVVLDGDLHARQAAAAALDAGTTLQELLVEGAEMVVERRGREPRRQTSASTSANSASQVAQEKAT